MCIDVSGEENAAIASQECLFTVMHICLGLVTWGGDDKHCEKNNYARHVKDEREGQAVSALAHREMMLVTSFAGIHSPFTFSAL